MNEFDLARNALSALSLMDNNPSADRKAFKFAVDPMISIQQKKNITLGSPVLVGWKITGRCNANCSHCWASLNKHDISRADLFRVANELVDINVMMVSISGGEPFLCQDLFDIIKIFKKGNIIIDILTNGSLIDSSTASKLADCLDLQTDTVQVSLDGSSSLIHDQQRGTHIFDRTINGIKVLRSHGIQVRAALCATHINQNDIFNTYVLANQLDVQTFSVTPVFSFRRGESEAPLLDSKLYMEELVRCKNSEKHMKTKLRLFAPHYYQQLLSKYYDDLGIDLLVDDNRIYDFNQKPCETNASMLIDANGEVLPGPQWDVRFSAGNVYKESIRSIWCTGKNWEEFRAGRDLRNTKCKNCKVYPFCQGGCMKYAYDKYHTICMPDGQCNVGG